MEKNQGGFFSAEKIMYFPFTSINLSTFLELNHRDKILIAPSVPHYTEKTQIYYINILYMA